MRGTSLVEVYTKCEWRRGLYKAGMTPCTWYCRCITGSVDYIEEVDSFSRYLQKTENVVTTSIPLDNRMGNKRIIKKQGGKILSDVLYMDGEVVKLV